MSHKIRMPKTHLALLMTQFVIAFALILHGASLLNPKWISVLSQWIAIAPGARGYVAVLEFVSAFAISSAVREHPRKTAPGARPNR